MFLFTLDALLRFSLISVVIVNSLIFTLYIIRRFHVLSFVDRANLKQPLAGPIYVRPPENNYKGPMNSRRACEYGRTAVVSVLPHYSLVDILNLVGARAPQGIHSALAHESRLRLGIWKPAGMRFTLYPLYTIFRVQQLDKGMRAVG